MTTIHGRRQHACPLSTHRELQSSSFLAWLCFARNKGYLIIGLLAVLAWDGDATNVDVALAPAGTLSDYENVEQGK